MISDTWIQTQRLCVRRGWLSNNGRHMCRPYITQRKWGRGGSYPSPKGEEDPVESWYYNVIDPASATTTVSLPPHGNRMRLWCQAFSARWLRYCRNGGQQSPGKSPVDAGWTKGGRERRLPSPLPPMVGRRDPREVLWKSSTWRIGHAECQRFMPMSTPTPP